MHEEGGEGRGCDDHVITVKFAEPLIYITLKNRVINKLIEKEVATLLPAIFC